VFRSLLLVVLTIFLTVSWPHLYGHAEQLTCIQAAEIFIENDYDWATTQKVLFTTQLSQDLHGSTEGAVGTTFLMAISGEILEIAFSDWTFALHRSMQQSSKRKTMEFLDSNSEKNKDRISEAYQYVSKVVAIDKTTFAEHLPFIHEYICQKLKIEESLTVEGVLELQRLIKEGFDPYSAKISLNGGYYEEFRVPIPQGWSEAKKSMRQYFIDRHFWTHEALAALEVNQ